MGAVAHGECQVCGSRAPIDMAARLVTLEAALRQIISPAAWSEIEPDTQAAYDLKRQKVEMQLIAAEALQTR